jgi:hypothetical protein
LFARDRITASTSDCRFEKGHIYCSASEHFPTYPRDFEQPCTFRRTAHGPDNIVC